MAAVAEIMEKSGKTPHTRQERHSMPVENKLKRMQKLALALAIVSAIVTLGMYAKIRHLRSELGSRQAFGTAAMPSVVVPRK